MTTVAERRKRAQEVIRLRDELGQQWEEIVTQLAEGELKLACEVKMPHCASRNRRLDTLNNKRRDLRSRRDKLGEELDSLAKELQEILKSLK